MITYLYNPNKVPTKVRCYELISGDNKEMKKKTWR